MASASVSSAPRAGLRQGDRIVEVNGAPVGGQPHADVFARIKSADDHVTLLVIDPAAEPHFRQRDVIADDAHVTWVTCPADTDTAATAAAAAVDNGTAQNRIPSRKFIYFI